MLILPSAPLLFIVYIETGIGTRLRIPSTTNASREMHFGRKCIFSLSNFTIFG
ncbi:hypothetical protein PUN28_015919 [Cardiocondyla obscurior]|uniref:Uncharacterized protein n=1 Tax=Cardiocondyla obscurior TaxID=286306 RepID=A0AAW2EVZ3_9HYME